MTRKRRSIRVILSLGCAAVAAISSGAEPRQEYDAKTAFLYNFALFTDWPATAPPGVVYCVVGEDRFGAALNALETARLRGAPVEVRRLPASGNIAKCHVMFIGTRDPAVLRQGVEAARGLPVLTVSDAPQAIESGVMIAMAYEKARVVFEVNLETVRGAGLTLSSKLLRLARAIH